MELKLIQTHDGSHTLYTEEFKEHYHSVFGAVQESLHVFLGTGFNQASKGKKKLNILEAGFGTGLNALLTCFAAEQKVVQVRYTGIELNPLLPGIYNKLNYSSFLPDKANHVLFKWMHTAEWGEEIRLTDYFTVTKLKSDIRNPGVPDDYYDLVYFDAFAPEVQPELWTEEVFRRYYESMTAGGILVTYSSKGDVKRALKNAGFKIEKLPGPPGKREILRALKK